MTNTDALLAEAKENAALYVQRLYKETMQTLTGNYPSEERDTWPMKREAAHAHEAGTATAAQTTTLTRFAAAKGVSVTDYVALILAKADGFEQVSAACEAARNQGLAAIEAATDAEAVQAAVDGLAWPQVAS